MRVQLQKIFDAGLKAAIPEGALSVSKWAETYRYVQRSARPGKWSNDVVPFLTEIMDVVTDPQVRKVVYMKSAQVAGPLSLDTEVPTPDGWVRMAEIKTGDQVFDEHGRPVTVAGVSEIFTNERCYEITFSDHSKMICDARHKWTVNDHTNTSTPKKVTLTTAEIAGTFRHDRGTRKRYSIPVAPPLVLPKQELPIDPYLLGAWLGDGHSHSNQITENAADANEIADQIRMSGAIVVTRPTNHESVVNLLIDPIDRRTCRRGHEMDVRNTSPKGYCRKCASQHTLHSRDGRARDPIVRRPSGFTRFQNANLIGNKHIPQSYLRADFDSRLSLLQGLMDTDGTITERGRCALTLANADIVDGVKDLLAGLGIKFTLSSRLSDRGFAGAKRKTPPVMHWKFSFLVYDDKPVFRLTRKRIKQPSRDGRRASETASRRIVDVAEVPSVPTRCITIDSPSHLFLAGRSMIPTHNSEFLVNVIGYYIHIDPTFIIYVAEKEDKARAWTNESFDTTVQNTAVLRNIVRLDSEDNNQRIKRYPGGQLTIVWATSPAELSSRPVRVLCFDEVDAYPLTREGSAVKLGEARTKTFSGSEKIIMVSTPRDASNSVIEKAYLEGDQREFWVPCPHCGDFQTLKWANVRWDDDPAEAYYVCEPCGAVIENDDKAEMLAKGRWIAAAKFRSVASFKINELYSPFTSWGAMALDFLEAKKSPDTLRVFVNTRLGETWKEEEKIEYADLQLSREEYAAEIPDGVLFLTAGVDVQGDRLEVFLAGWGRDLECWAIDYRVLEGSPAMPDVWDDLGDYLTEVRSGKDQEFRVAAACIDSGGHHTQEVYKFCHRYKGRRWFAVKGANVPGKPIVSKPTVVGSNPKVKLFTVGTDTAKDTIFAFLRNGEPGTPGYIHFPADDRFDDSYLRGLCSEKKVTRFRMGQKYQVWEKVSAKVRNEPLDTFVYSLAAVSILRPNFRRIEGRQQREPVENGEQFPEVAREKLETALERVATKPEPAQAPPEAKKKRAGRIRIKNRFSGYKVGY